VTSIPIPEAWHEAGYSLIERYLEYHIVLELLFFFALFGGLARATLKERFPGPQGKLISIVVGLMLSTSLTLGMAHWGLSLLDFASVPLALLGCVLLLLTASMMRRHKVDGVTAVGVGLLFFGIVGIRIISPAGAMRSFDFESIFYFLIVFVVLRLVYVTFKPRSSPEGPERAREKLDASRRNVRSGSQAIKGYMRSAIQGSYGLLERLKRIREELATRKRDPETRHALEAAVVQAGDIEGQVNERLNRIGRIAKILRREQARTFADLSSAAGRADAGDQTEIKRDLAVEWKELGDEQAVQALARKASHHARRMRRDLAKAVRCLSKGETERADRWLGIAAKRQRELNEILLELARWEERLDRTVEKEPVKESEER